MKILALDLGKFNTMCCFFDSKTRKHEFLNATTDRNYLETIFKKHKIDLVVMEACGPSGWINDLAQSLGLKTLVCSTNEDAWKWSNVKRKTDKDDALKLARMAAMNELKAVHMPSEAHREFRSIVKYRKTLDSRINKMKCKIRAWFVNHGISIDTGEKAWNTGRERINSFRKPLTDCQPHEFWKGELDLELNQLDSLTTILDGVVKKLESIGKTDPRIARVQTIPGVGPRTAEILVECAWSSLRYNPWAKHVYDRICGKQKTRKKKAAIALARKIAVLAWALLRDEKDWEPKRMIEVTESYGRIPLGLKEKLLEMPKKECRHKRKNRRVSEERVAKRAAAEQAAQTPKSTLQPTKSTPKRSPVRSSAAGPAKRKPTTTTTKGKPTKTKAKPTANPRRIRKLETAG
jgi:hypothetical protein